MCRKSDGITEARMQQEAQERLNAKFGEEGLAHQVGMYFCSDIQSMGSTPVEPDVTPLGVDIAKTVDEYRRNGRVICSLTKTLTDMGAGVVKTIKESKITESIGNGVQTVKEKLTDPNLQNEIRESVQSGTRNREC